MRIMAGMFILYVQLAYTRDLYEFFGPRAWGDLEFTNEWRQTLPYFKPAAEWTDSTNITVPADRVARKAFVSWAKKRPADPARRQDALRYVMTLPPNLKDMQIGRAHV